MSLLLFFVGARLPIRPGGAFTKRPDRLHRPDEPEYSRDELERLREQIARSRDRAEKARQDRLQAEQERYRELAAIYEEITGERKPVVIPPKPKPGKREKQAIAAVHVANVDLEKQVLAQISAMIESASRRLAELEEEQDEEDSILLLLS